LSSCVLTVAIATAETISNLAAASPHPIKVQMDAVTLLLISEHPNEGEPNRAAIKGVVKQTQS
jgi:hypothetical protein